MSNTDPNQAIREAARDVLREMVPEIVRELTADANGKTNGNGHAPHAHSGDEMVVPRVPAPPVAAVLRPSTWDRPAAPGRSHRRPVIGAPGEVIGAPGEVIGAPAGRRLLSVPANRKRRAMTLESRWSRSTPTRISSGSSGS